MPSSGWLIGLAALAAILMYGTVAFCAEPVLAWPADLYDPAPSTEGSLTLPLPCGGKMVFCKVSVLAAGELKDARFMVGGTDDSVGYLEERRPAYLAGSFSEKGSQAARSYYIGKYEVTEAQYAALDSTCSALGVRARFPKTGVSWFAAVDFARRYTLWLNKNAPSALPTEGDARGFLRLPTEAEWEFAARGGRAVASDVAFLDDLFPMPDGDVSHYVWFQGTGSAEGKLQRAGLLKPNPLGLHDVLGNASEMVLDPFRMHWHGRLHGQTGGFVVRGGSFNTAQAEVRNSSRDEIPFYDHRSGDEMRRDDVGFRLVIATQVMTSYDRLEKLRGLWREAQGEPRQVGADPLVELEGAVPTIDSPEARTAVLGALTTLRADATRRNEAAERSAQSMIRLGAFLGKKVAEDQVKLRYLSGGIKIDEEALEEKVQLEPDPTRRAQKRALLEKSVPELAQNREKLVRQRITVEKNLEYYGEIVIEVAERFDSKMLNSQLKVIQQILEGKNIAALNPFAETFVGHVESFRKHKKVDNDAMVKSLMTIASSREKSDE